MCAKNNVYENKINVHQCMLDLWVNVKKDNMCIMARPLVALAIDAYTQSIVGAYCALGDKGTEKLQIMINEVLQGSQVFTKDLVTIVDFRECTEEVMDDIFCITTPEEKGQTELYWKVLRRELDKKIKKGYALEVEEFLDILSIVLQEVKRNGTWCY